MRLIRTSMCAALACLALAACVPAPPKPTPAPAPAPRPTRPVPPAPPTPVPSFGNWMDAPLTPGDWSYGGGRASFGEPGTRPHLTLTCDAGGISIGYFGTATQPASMTIRTEFMDRAIGQVILGAGIQGAVPVTGRVHARDPLLDAMAFSKGRFAVEVSGAPTLYVPAYPEVTRVIEDCR